MSRVALAALLIAPLASPSTARGQEAVRVLDAHRGSVLDVAFSPDGKVLASCSRDRTIKFWHPATGKLLRTLTDHTADVYSVAFSPRGDLLASGSRDRSVRLWDAM